MKTHLRHLKYPKIRSWGYDGTDDILAPGNDIIITPKIDGSNVSVWLGNNEMRLSRRNGWLGESDKGFQPFIDWASYEWAHNLYWRSIADRDNYIVVFGEFANNQNKLKYEKKSPMIVFDSANTVVDPNGDMHLSFNHWTITTYIAQEMMADLVPVLFYGKTQNFDSVDEIIDAFLNKKSFLGGCNEEGVVVKDYNRTTRYGGRYFCKLVTAEFAERNAVKTKVTRIGTGIGEWAADSFFNEARLNKAIQRMQEEGRWNEENAKKNIGPLIGVVCKDIQEEHMDEISQKAVQAAWKEVSKTVSSRVAPLLDEMIMREREHE